MSLLLNTFPVLRTPQDIIQDFFYTLIMYNFTSENKCKKVCAIPRGRMKVENKNRRKQLKSRYKTLKNISV